MRERACVHGQTTSSSTQGAPQVSGTRPPQRRVEAGVLVRWMYYLANVRQTKMCSPKKKIMGGFRSSHVYYSYLSHEFLTTESGGADLA